MGIVNTQIFHHYAAATINVLFADGPAHAVFVGTTGSLLLETLDGVSVTFASVPGGTVVPCRALRYLATSTAGGIVALYTRKEP